LNKFEIVHVSNLHVLNLNKFKICSKFKFCLKSKFVQIQKKSNSNFEIVKILEKRRKKKYKKEGNRYRAGPTWAWALLQAEVPSLLH
jgi:hypothetical protein